MKKWVFPLVNLFGSKLEVSYINLQLEKDNFLLGPEITVFDFSIAAMLASILFHTPKTWLTVLAESYPVVPDYLARVSDRLGGFPFTRSEPTT